MIYPVGCEKRKFKNFLKLINESIDKNLVKIQHKTALQIPV